MPAPPRISIVTPVLDPSRQATGAIESVMAQGYSDVEHIVMAGAGTEASLAGHPRLHVISAGGRGRAAALNAGFSAATGDIWGVLDADARLLPGALARVGAAIDGERGPRIVVGRCRVLDERGRLTGIEHPSPLGRRRRILETWRGEHRRLCAVFWTPDVWRTSGPLDETTAGEWADTDLSFRLSGRHPIHRVDEALAATVLETSARSAGLVPGTLERGIAWSRRRWGSPLHPTYWRLALGLAWYRFDRIRRARHRVRRATARPGRGGRIGAVRDLAVAMLLAPEVVFYVACYPPLLERATRSWRTALERVGQWSSLSPETAVYLDVNDAWSDGWVGPRLVVTREVHGQARSVGIRGWVDTQYFRIPFVLTVRVNGRLVGRHPVAEPGDFLARLALPAPVSPGVHTVDLEASTWFVPDRHTGSGDQRPLSWRFGAVELDGAA